MDLFDGLRMNADFLGLRVRALGVGKKLAHGLTQTNTDDFDGIGDWGVGSGEKIRTQMNTDEHRFLIGGRF